MFQKEHSGCCVVDEKQRKENSSEVIELIQKKDECGSNIGALRKARVK